MAHIHTLPGQHDHTVSGYIIRTDLDEPKLFLHMHKKLKVYMDFGGHIELDENPWQALKHELLEESGYSMDQLLLLQPKDVLLKVTGANLHPTPLSYLTVPFDKDHIHTDIAYAFLADSDPAAKVDQNESNDFRLLSRDETENLPSTEIIENVREIGLFIFDVCLPKWQRIPATSFN